MTDAAASGDVRVDSALESLTALDELPVDRHLPLLERAHTVLRAALTGDEESLDVPSSTDGR